MPKAAKGSKATGPPLSGKAAESAAAKTNLEAKLQYAKELKKEGKQIAKEQAQNPEVLEVVNEPRNPDEVQTPLELSADIPADVLKPAPSDPKWEQRKKKVNKSDGYFSDETFILGNWNDFEPYYIQFVDSKSYISLLTSYLGCGADRSCRFPEIGKGGQGAVYVVNINGTLCAMKISDYNDWTISWFYPTEKAQKDTMTMRMREGNALSITSGYKIFPDLYCCCVTTTKVITFMQLLNGWMPFSNFLRNTNEGIRDDGTKGNQFQTISQISRGGVPDYRLRRRIIRNIMAELYKCLQRLWGLGYVHIDLKPANFMIKIKFPTPGDLSIFSVEVILIDPGSVGKIGDPYISGLYPSTPGYSIVQDTKRQLKEGFYDEAARMFLRENPKGTSSAFSVSKTWNEYSFKQIRERLKEYGINLSIPATGGGKRTRKRTIHRKKTHKKKRRST